MFNLSEMIFIAILALIVIGPRQLPEVARNLGRMMNEFRRASEAVFAELKKPQAESKNLMKDLAKNLTETPAPTATKNKDESKS